MENFWSYVSVSLISSGFGATIIFGLSKWLGGVWSNRILENERQENRIEIECLKNEFQTKLEEVKNEFQKEFNKFDKLNEKAIYISKTQYDKEFEIYQEIWSKFYNLNKVTLNLCSPVMEVPVDEDDRDKFHINNYDDFLKKLNEFEEVTEKYLPFYKESFSIKFNEFKKYCLEIGFTYKTYNIDVKHNESFKCCRDFTMSPEEFEDFYKNLPKKITGIKQDLITEIREYLYSLQII